MIDVNLFKEFEKVEFEWYTCPILQFSASKGNQV